MGMEISNTILAQLGGNRFRAMTGAKDFVGGENFLMFRLPGAGGFCKDGINKVKIILEPSDTYTMIFYKIRGVNVKEVAKVEDAYAEDMGEIFESKTGLYVSL